MLNMCVCLQVHSSGVVCEPPGVSDQERVSDVWRVGLDRPVTSRRGGPSHGEYTEGVIINYSGRGRTLRGYQ